MSATVAERTEDAAEVAGAMDAARTDQEAQQDQRKQPENELRCTICGLGACWTK
jgi:hypothetical protein